MGKENSEKNLKRTYYYVGWSKILANSLAYMYLCKAANKG